MAEVITPEGSKHTEIRPMPMYYVANHFDYTNCSWGQVWFGVLGWFLHPLCMVLSKLLKGSFQIGVYKRQEDNTYALLNVFRVIKPNKHETK